MDAGCTARNGMPRTSSFASLSALLLEYAAAAAAVDCILVAGTHGSADVRTTGSVAAAAAAAPTVDDDDTGADTGVAAARTDGSRTIFNSEFVTESSTAEWPLSIDRNCVAVLSNTSALSRFIS